MGQPVDASQVKLLSAVRLPVCHSALVPVQLKGAKGFMLVEQSITLENCLQIQSLNVSYIISWKFLLVWKQTNKTIKKTKETILKIYWKSDLLTVLIE